MINLSRKLYISILSLLLLFVVAGTVTFAWFKLNTNAWVSDLEIGADTNADLKISVDGINYASNLTNGQIAESIVAYANDWKLCWDEGKQQNYWKKSEDKEDNEYITEENLESEMEKIHLKPVTSIDGKKFESLNGTPIELKSKWYIKFDLYFKSVSSEVQDVYFSNRVIAYEDGTIIPKTEITVDKVEQITFPDNILASFDTYQMTTGKIIHYDASDKEAKLFDGTDVTDDFENNFKTYVSDASRFSITTSSNGVESNDVKLYELNKGNGSYATTMIERASGATNNTSYIGTSGVAYDATKNAAFTYYNTVRRRELIAGTGTDGEIDPISYKNVPSTYKGLDTTDAAKIITLDDKNNYGNQEIKGQVGTAKMTMTLWLEGWDADCIDTILDQKIKINLSFTNYNTAVENKPTTLTYLVTNPTTKEIVDRSKVRNQIYNMNITDDAPAYFENDTHSFKGWARSDENGNVIESLNNTDGLWDFSQNVKPKTDDEKWYLVSVWE